MKKNRIRFIISALAVCLICACMPVSVFALPVDCGGGVTWHHDSDTDTEIFSGNGAMSDFEPDPDHTTETYDRVVIEAGVSYVGAYLFDSDYIGELVLPDAPLTVNVNAFSECVIDSVVFPQTAVDVTQYNFVDEVHNPNAPFGGSAAVFNLDLGGLNGFPGGFSFTYGDNYELQSLIVGANTKGIPEYCCNCFGALETLTLPDGLTSINGWAFESCEALQTVRIPDSVTEIGDYAFDCCWNLETLTLPEQLLTIGDYAFCGCEGLTSVTIPPHTTDIGMYAFADCINLAEVTIPNSIRRIEISAFAGTAVQNVHLPKGLQYIYDSSFGTSLTYVCCDTENCPVIREFAENAGIEFRLCDGHGMTARVAGDASGDGVLNLKDTVLIRRYLAEGWDVEIDEAAADVDGDGEVSLKDVALLERYLAGGWDVELP